MDHSADSANLFHRHADVYRQNYMDLTMYDDYYRKFCQLLPSSRARVLDAACGPGNVARYLMAQRHDLDLLGIDLAPRMIELARAAVPSARFIVHDCRKLAELESRFDGIICAFGLPYLSLEQGLAFIRSACDVLEPAGALYLSTMLGTSQDSGLQRCSTGDQLYITYYREDEVVCPLRQCGLTILAQAQIPSPSNASHPTTDLIVIARK